MSTTKQTVSWVFVGIALIFGSDAMDPDRHGKKQSTVSLDRNPAAEGSAAPGRKKALPGGYGPAADRDQARAAWALAKEEVSQRGFLDKPLTKVAANSTEQDASEEVAPQPKPATLAQVEAHVQDPASEVVAAAAAEATEAIQKIEIQKAPGMPQEEAQAAVKVAADKLTKAAKTIAMQDLLKLAEAARELAGSWDWAPWNAALGALKANAAEAAQARLKAANKLVENLEEMQRRVDPGAAAAAGFKKDFTKLVKAIGGDAKQRDASAVSVAPAPAPAASAAKPEAEALAVSVAPPVAPTQPTNPASPKVAAADQMDKMKKAMKREEIARAHDKQLEQQRRDAAEGPCNDGDVEALAAPAPCPFAGYERPCTCANLKAKGGCDLQKDLWPGFCSKTCGTCTVEDEEPKANMDKEQQPEEEPKAASIHAVPLMAVLITVANTA